MKAWRRALHKWDKMESISFSTAVDGTEVGISADAGCSSGDSKTQNDISCTNSSDGKQRADTSNVAPNSAAMHRASQQCDRSSSGSSRHVDDSVKAAELTLGGAVSNIAAPVAAVAEGEEVELAAAEWGADLPDDNEIDDDEDVL